MTEPIYLGIDVGTGSARAGLFDQAGCCVGTGVAPIQTFRPADDHVEQSSDDIWQACGRAVGTALRAGGIPPSRVAGIGFDATCSLVALDADDRPVTVSTSGDDAQNVVVWMDHRAIDQVTRINQNGHDVLRYVGGVMSPEMQPPKLLWLKEHLPESWRRTRRFLDLPDYLVYRATGRDVRSLCTTVCKWTYQGHRTQGVASHQGAESAAGWDASFFQQVGLGDLAEDGFARIGTDVRPMGERAGLLGEDAARELGLPAGVPVAVAIIDAHAGGLGMIGVHLDGGQLDAVALERRLALIGGTSSCHMAVAAQPRFIDGIWGPYFSAMVPDLWLTEGGQSATGALIDHVIDSHARGPELRAIGEERHSSVYALLNERLLAMAGEAAALPSLTESLHVLPYFHGNRSPRADPTLRGMVSGLKLGHSVDALALSYWATVQAIALGTRHIVEAMNAGGYAIDTIIACGGDTKNPLFVQAHADATGCRVVMPREPEAVLLGSAILGAVASGAVGDIYGAMQAMAAPGDIVLPEPGGARDFYDRKYRVFARMYDDQLAYRRLMAD